jgi:hypothetical protein
MPLSKPQLRFIELAFRDPTDEPGSPNLPNTVRVEASDGAGYSWARDQTRVLSVSSLGSSSPRQP